MFWYGGGMNDSEFYSLINAGPSDDDPILAYDAMTEAMTPNAKVKLSYDTVKVSMKLLVQRGWVEIVEPGTGRKKSWMSAAKIRRTSAGDAALEREMDARVETNEELQLVFKKRMSGRRAIRLPDWEVPPDVRAAVQFGLAVLVVKAIDE